MTKDSLYRVTRCFRVTYHKNPISGHEWPEHEPLDMWEVSGGKWLRSSFRLESAAIAEVELRERMDKKFNLV